VKSSPYSPTTANWTASSNFDLGAYDYLTYGGFNVSDDVIDEFTVMGPALSDTTPPMVSMSAPANGATVSGKVTVSANATDNVGVAGVQFKLDGANLGAVVTGAGPVYSVSWDTTTVSNASHTLATVATDTAGNSATSASISVTVSNPPVITSVTAGAITSSGATITWTTNQASDSQVAYGTSSTYGSTSALNSTLVTSHSVILSGLAASTTYHYQVLSRDAQGLLASSRDFTFTTGTSTTGQPILQIHADATEVSGVTNGSVVTPSIAPAGFTGTVVANGFGSVNYTAAQVGNGVYFLNCCAKTNNAYYQFPGAAVGNIFNMNQGKISFYLKSRYSFAQRMANASALRYAFDVRDGNGHQFFFITQTTATAPPANLLFTYAAAGTAEFYYVPSGTEDTLFGNGVILQVTITWNGSVINLYLNGTLVKSSPYSPTTANWTASSNFDLGAYDYLTYGGRNVSDDVIDEFTVSQQ
jgi:hypothetical protein